ncbi:penicillin-binding protein 2 [Candidatus Uhrbacteria bacterium]|nr:penicillin-binding protein 2 [Candidatus Uhrbacteria bacterium]
MKRNTPFAPAFPDTLSLKRKSAHEWVESTAAFAGWHDAVQFLGTTIGRKKISLLFFIIILILGLFLARSASLQLWSGRGFAVLAQNNKIKTVTISARRGVLYDRNGAQLVQNIPRFVLQVNRTELPAGTDERMRVNEALASLSGIPASEIALRIERHRVAEPLVLLDEIEYSQALDLIVKTADMQGVEVVLRDRRNYVFEKTQSISHIVGHMGMINPDEYAGRSGSYRPTDSIGKDGIELQYEKELRGIDGKKEIEVNALGAERRILSEDEPRDGKSIILSIDTELQSVAEESLKKILEKFKTSRGVVIVSDPRTGEILALVSLPAFDNNIFSKKISPEAYADILKNPDRPLFNRAIQGEYPAGSTIKPLVAAAALQEHIVDADSSFLSSGGIRIGQWFFPDWKEGGHGRTNLGKALAESVNTYFYIVAGGYNGFAGLGQEKLLSYYRRFGIDKKTGIDLPGEHAGFIPSPEWKKERTGEPWYIGDTYHSAIGQGDILVTPLAIHLMTEYFANGGWALQPRLFLGYKSSDGAPSISSEKNYVLRGIIDPAYIEDVRQGLRQTILVGSGRRLSTLPITSAGKTGTAQWKSTARPHAWFTGWAPFEKPEIAVTVLVEEGEEGSRSAIAVADDILRWYGVKKQKSSPSRQGNASGVDK